MNSVRPTIAYAKKRRTTVVVGICIIAVVGTLFFLLLSAFGPGEPATGQSFEDFVQKKRDGYYQKQDLFSLVKFWIYVGLVLVPHKIILRSKLFYHLMLVIQSAPVAWVVWGYLVAIYFSFTRKESILMHLVEFLIFTVLYGVAARLLSKPPISLWTSRQATLPE